MREWGKEEREKPAEVAKELEVAGKIQPELGKGSAKPEWLEQFEQYTQPKRRNPRTIEGTNFFSIGVLGVVWFIIIKYWIIDNPGFFGINLRTVFIAIVGWYTLKLLFPSRI